MSIVVSSSSSEAAIMERGLAEVVRRGLLAWRDVEALLVASRSVRAATQTALSEAHLIVAVGDGPVSSSLLLCTRLHSLRVSMASFTDAKAVALAAHVHSLRELDVSDSFLGDEGVIALVTSNGGGLHTLRLDNLQMLTDQALVQIGWHCQHLSSLSLKGCIQLTDEGVSQLAPLAGELLSMDLGGAMGVTDASVEALVRGAPGLAFLGVRGCVGVSDASIRALLEHKHLKGLCLDASATSVSPDLLVELNDLGVTLVTVDGSHVAPPSSSSESESDDDHDDDDDDDDDGASSASSTTR